MKTFTVQNHAITAQIMYVMLAVMSTLFKMFNIIHIMFSLFYWFYVMINVLFVDFTATTSNENSTPFISLKSVTIFRFGCFTKSVRFIFMEINFIIKFIFNHIFLDPHVLFPRN